jgi:hypothetical protein
MTHWRTKKILAIARAAKVAKAQREIMQNGNNIIKRGRGRPPRKVQMNGGGGQVDYNNAARKVSKLSGQLKMGMWSIFGVTPTTNLRFNGLYLIIESSE